MTLAGRLVLLAVALGLLGCASTPPWPAGFTAAQARFEPDPRPPAPVIEGPAGKVGGGLQGAAWGGGIGFVIGLLADSGCSYVCGASTALGAIMGITGGAIVGAVASESEAEVSAKRRWLAAAVAERSLAGELAQALRAGARAAGEVPAQWAVTVSIVAVETVGHSRNTPFGLRVRAVLRLRPADARDRKAGDEHPFEAASRDSHVIADWRADGNAALHRALDESVQSLAAQILTAMRPQASAR